MALKKERIPGVPVQIQEAAEMAEDLHESMYPTTEETPSEELPAEELGEETPGEEEQPAELAGEETSTETIPEEGATDWSEEYKKLEQKHKTLEGKYNAEVPESRSRADRLENEMNLLKKTFIEKISDTPPAEETVPEEIQLRKDRAAAWKEEFGDDYAEGARAFFLEEISPFIDQKVKPINDQVTTLAEERSVEAQGKFVEVVGSNLPDGVKDTWQEDWMTENNNPEFEAFLKQPDPYGLYTNGQLAESFSDKGQADKFAALLNRFYGERTATDPQPPNVPVTKEVKAPSPDAMVAPSRTATQATLPETDDKIIWTQDTAKAFYEKDRKNGYSEDESAKLWQDILSAPAEGRMSA